MFVFKIRIDVKNHLVCLLVLVILILQTQAEPDRMTRKARVLQILGSYQAVKSIVKNKLGLSTVRFTLTILEACFELSISCLEVILKLP